MVCPTAPTFTAGPVPTIKLKVEPYFPSGSTYASEHTVKVSIELKNATQVETNGTRKMNYIVKLTPFDLATAYDAQTGKVVDTRANQKSADCISSPTNCIKNTNPIHPHWGSPTGKSVTKTFTIEQDTQFAGGGWKNPGDFFDFKTYFKLNMPATDAVCPIMSFPGCLGVWNNDYVKIDTDCGIRVAPKSKASFPLAAWSQDFSGLARRSWAFTDDSLDPATILNKSYAPSKNTPFKQFWSKGYYSGTWTLNSTGGFIKPASPTSPAATFKINSIIKNCVIDSTADFVSGFFVCDNLYINKRNKPLRIIGTFIVGHMYIDESAILAGIRWSSIYHPSALSELRDARVLKVHELARTTPTDDSCNNQLSAPIWHPQPSTRDILNLFTCNVVSLREQANPFQWTSVTPDCAVEEDTATGLYKSKCKYRTERLILREFSRQEIKQ